MSVKIKVEDNTSWISLPDLIGATAGYADEVAKQSEIGGSYLRMLISQLLELDLQAHEGHG